MLSPAALLARAEEGGGLSRAELAFLLGAPGIDADLLAAADRVRRRRVGDQVHLRGLIEFSSRCARSCRYCGLRRENLALPRFQLPPGEIVALAARAAGWGCRTVVLQSGEGGAYRRAELVEVIRAVKRLGLAVTLSIGEKPRADYQAYREAGADRYLLRIETSDRALYRALHPGMSYDRRLRCLRDLADLGYELGTGCLVGLPGQTLESLADDLLLFRELEADMIGLGPFVPNRQTPLGAAPPGSLDLALRVMALARLLLPDANIPATTAMETLDPEGRTRALRGGANVVMPNITEGDARRLYALYPGKAGAGEEPAQAWSGMVARLAALGRPAAAGPGSRRRCG